jgi:signal transduction histidine kinase
MKGPGPGLIGMKERLRLVDEELVIESQPQEGTTIRARARQRTDEDSAL